jgi:hypothetical protein
MTHRRGVKLDLSFVPIMEDLETPDLELFLNELLKQPFLCIFGYILKANGTTPCISLKSKTSSGDIWSSSGLAM